MGIVAIQAADVPVWRVGRAPDPWAWVDRQYADVRSADTIAALRPTFLRLALALGCPDFDASALKSAYPRALTQSVSSHLYALTGEGGRTVIDGVRFASRHGDELTLWAIFERPDDEPSSRHLREVGTRLVAIDDPDLARAMTLHGLTWR